MRGLTGALIALAGAATAATPSGGEGIVALQPARHVDAVTVEAGGAPLRLRWTDLNPAVHAWFLLAFETADGRATAWWHLENADPARQRIRLDRTAGGALVVSADGGELRCTPWAGAGASALERARRTGLAFAPLCEGRLYLRNPVRGHRTPLEATTEFLRDHVWAGERIVGFVRSGVFRDAFVERANLVGDAEASLEAPADAPSPAPVRTGFERSRVSAEGLGILNRTTGSGVPLGRWMPALGLPGVHVSVMQPAALPESSGRPWKPDSVEAEALVYLVAFDLTRFEIGFALGTEHPRIGWSARVPAARRDAARPGPDGIDTAEPLVRTGMVLPSRQGRTVATFTGGFKREHGAFKWGPFAGRNDASHYGFVEQGVVFSRLVPGLSTLFVLDDGEVGLRTWTEADAALMPRIRDARQNGVPLVETPAGSAQPRVGALVDQWGPGNWSGSADERLRSLRAGACLVDAGGRRHLVYGYFSAAVPATMAQVFLAYGCRDAMHLDMNALEHTYLATYVREDDRIRVQHLVKGMAQLDRGTGAAPVPRFLGFADDRDFFSVMRRHADR